MKINLTESELWTLVTCLCHRGNELNNELASIQNYFKHNESLTWGFLVHCETVVGEAIDIATLHIELLQRLPQDNQIKEDIQSAAENLKVYKDAYNCLASPDNFVEVQVKNSD